MYRHIWTGISQLKDIPLYKYMETSLYIHASGGVQTDFSSVHVAEDRT